MLLGAGVGVLLNPTTDLVSQSFSTWLANWLDLPGQIFIRLVQMVMIPLIITSIISGIISNSTENLKSFGLQLLLYFIFTTTVAIIIGLFVSLIMKPGQYFLELGGFPNSGGITTIPAAQQTSFMEDVPNAISNLIPNNPLESILSGEMLGVVIFTILIGVAITQLEKSTASPIIRFAEAVQKICMIVISWAMMLVPYAVFGLIAALTARIGIDVFFGLAYYILVVIIGLALLMVFYLVLVFTITKKNHWSICV